MNNLSSWCMKKKMRGDCFKEIKRVHQHFIGMNLNLNCMLLQSRSIQSLWRQKSSSSSSSSSTSSSLPSSPSSPSSSVPSSSLPLSSSSLLITPSCYKDKTLFELILISLLFKLCSYDSLISSVSKIILDKRNNITTRIVKKVLSKTIFLYFCGGNNFDDCKKVVNNYYNNYNISTIIDHSTEEFEVEACSHQNLIQKIHLLTTIGDSNTKIQYIPIKCTALMNPFVLEKLTTLINENENDIIDKLNDSDKQLFENGMKRFFTLCKLSKAKKISLLLDAEQSNRQPAIEFIYNILAQKYNKVDVSTIPVIFNTYQMYLNRTLGALERDIKLSKKLGYHFGAKVVRGAYMKSESKRVPSIVLKNKYDVDSNYELAIKLCLKEVELQQRENKLQKSSFLFATHNRNSINLIVDTMQDYKIDKASKNVGLAQIKGMSDHLTNACGLAGFNVSKLVPYGDFENVLPWLVRRLEENSDLFSSMQQERVYYHKEILRRLKF